MRHASLAAPAGQALVVGTHGMALTVWLAGRFRLAPNPTSFWSGLEFPDVIVVDLGTLTVRRV